jgi:RNA polymerase sigma-70 factor, ECF subfamily
MPEPKNSNSDPTRHLESMVYEELKQLASAMCRRHKSATLTTTALLHDAWMKLKDSPQLRGLTPEHFKSVAAHAMRQIVVDAARRRNAQKRGGGEVVFVTSSNAPAEKGLSMEEVLAVHEVLEELETFSPRQAKMIECRFFGDLTVAETAAALGVSESAIERDWRAARAWLNGKLQSRKE